MKSPMAPGRMRRRLNLLNGTFAFCCMRNLRPLLFISAAASAIYLLTGGAAIKGCAVGALALLAMRARGAKRDAGLLALGLALSTVGDVLLDLDPKLFVFGLAAFLLAHLTYITLFVRNRARPLAPGPWRVAAVLAVLAYSATLSAWIVPSVGGLAVPVELYIGAITAMVSMAILARFEKPWVAVGAVLFLISDSLLAIHKFKTPVPLRNYLVWASYYLGQCGIALGFLTRRVRFPNKGLRDNSGAPRD
jgi:uncharacterized membrane protein YhhN